MPKTNFNATASAGATAQVAPENNARQSFFFQNLSASNVMVLNFGAAATANNILTVPAGGSIAFDKSSPYNFEKQINVFCAGSDVFQAQGDE